MKTSNAVLIFTLYNIIIIVLVHVSNDIKYDVKYKECLKTERECKYAIQMEFHANKNIATIDKYVSVMTEVGNESCQSIQNFPIGDIGNIVRCYKYSNNTEKPAELLKSCHIYKDNPPEAMFMLMLLLEIAITLLNIYW